MLVAISICSLCVYRCHARNLDWATTDRLYAAAVDACPSSARIHNNLGTRLLRAREIDTAQHHFQAAVDSTPEFPLALHNLGLTYFFQSQLEIAVQLFRESLQFSDQSNGMAYNNMGMALRDLDRKSEADDAFKKAKQLKQLAREW